MNTQCIDEGCRNEALHFDADNLGFCITHGGDYQITSPHQPSPIMIRLIFTDAPGVTRPNVMTSNYPDEYYNENIYMKDEMEYFNETLFNFEEYIRNIDEEDYDGEPWYTEPVMYFSDEFQKRIDFVENIERVFGVGEGDEWSLNCIDPRIEVITKRWLKEGWSKPIVYDTRPVQNDRFCQKQKHKK